MSLSASGLPSGVTAAFSPNPAITASTLTLAASNTATPGKATVTVTGTSGGLTSNTTIALTVTQITPDLIVSALAAPSTVGAGSSFTRTDTTKNQGAGAADVSTTSFYLFTNSVLDSADTPLGSRAVPALAAGASSSASTMLTVPAGTPTGAYYLIAKADADNLVAKTREDNNTYLVYLQVGPGPTALMLSAPAKGGCHSGPSACAHSTHVDGPAAVAANGTQRYAGF